MPSLIFDQPTERQGSDVGRTVTTPRAGVYTAEHIDGRTLERMLRRSSPSQKAVIAADLCTGRLEVGPLTDRQARLLARASYGYTNIASKLADLERFAVRTGTRKLAEFAGKAARTHRDFDRFVGRYPKQLMAAVDRYTRPQLPLQAAE